MGRQASAEQCEGGDVGHPAAPRCPGAEGHLPQESRGGLAWVHVVEVRQ